MGSVSMTLITATLGSFLPPVPMQWGQIPDLEHIYHAVPPIGYELSTAGACTQQIVYAFLFNS